MKTQKTPNIAVGEIVSVLCVNAQLYDSEGNCCRIIHNLPVLPYEPHEDSEILDFPYEHYHYDWRFFTDSMIRKLFGGKKFKLSETMFFQNQSIYESPPDWPPTVQRVDTVVGEPFCIELACVREMPFLATHYTLLQALERAYEGCKLEGHVCPHRGYATLPADEQTTGCSRICPGHGLGYDRQGKLSPRYCT